LSVAITRHYDLIIKGKPTVTTSSVPNHAFVWFRRISNAFEGKFSDLKELDTDFAIFSNQFSVSAEEVPQKYQI